MSLVVSWATASDLEEMQRCLEGGDHAATFEEFESWDLALHRCLMAASHSPLLIALYQVILTFARGGHDLHFLWIGSLAVPDPVLLPVLAGLAEVAAAWGLKETDAEAAGLAVRHRLDTFVPGVVPRTRVRAAELGPDAAMRGAALAVVQRITADPLAWITEMAA